MDPAQLRKEIIERRKSIPKEIRNQIFQQISKFFFDLPVYIQAASVICYFGKTSSGEFDTSSMLNQILQDSKNLYLPRCREGEIGLDLYQILDLSQDLESGSYGLREPKKIQQRFSTVCQITNPIIIVPGSVFDHSGNRYGYGAGFYDRFLKETRENNGFIPTTIAFTHSFAVMDSPLETKEHDIPVDIIITEQEVLYVKVPKNLKIN